MEPVEPRMAIRRMRVINIRGEIRGALPACGILSSCAGKSAVLCRLRNFIRPAVFPTGHPEDDTFCSEDDTFCFLELIRAPRNFGFSAPTTKSQPLRTTELES